MTQENIGKADSEELPAEYKTAVKKVLLPYRLSDDATEGVMYVCEMIYNAGLLEGYAGGLNRWNELLTRPHENRAEMLEQTRKIEPV